MIIGFYNGVPGVKAIHKKASPQNSRDNLQQVEIRRFSLSTLRTRLKRKNKNIFFRKTRLIINLTDLNKNIYNFKKNFLINHNPISIMIRSVYYVNTYKHIDKFRIYNLSYIPIFKIHKYLTLWSQLIQNQIFIEIKKKK